MNHVGRSPDDPLDAARAAVADLAAEGFPVMILAEAVRGPAAGEPAGASRLAELSLLVPPTVAGDVAGSLTRAGWSFPADALRERALGAIAARHSWPLGRGPSLIDLRHFATPLNRLRRDDDRLWRFSAPITCRGVVARTPRPEHALLLALVEGVCGAPHRRPAWIERAGRLLDRPPLDWTELLHDVRLRFLEAIVHRGLETVVHEHAAVVPWGVLQTLEVDSTDTRREEVARLEAAAAADAEPGTCPEYVLALARYRRRHELADPVQAATSPAATLAPELPPDGAPAWVAIPFDKVSTDWLVLKVSVGLPATLSESGIALRVMLPGLPVGSIPLATAGSGPQGEHTVMLPFHQGFLRARGIEMLGLRLHREGRPVVCGRAVPVRIDCLMAVTARPAPVAPSPPRRPAAAAGAPRLVLCRPRGGLNDALNQIAVCWDYAERFGRRLVVDASRSGLHAPLSDYFTARDPAADVVLHPTPADEEAFERLTARPPELAGRIGGYAAAWDDATECHRDVGAARVPVRFDRDRPHAESLLVHEQCGGGSDSLDALRRLRFTDPVAAIVRSRLAPLGGGYAGVHVRHTDDRVDAEGFLASLREPLAGRRVLVCTDNPRVVDLARRMLAASEVLTATTLADVGGMARHAPAAFPDPASRRRANLDALVDLMALAHAETVLLRRCFSGRLSGFGVLAKLLSGHRDVRDGLFG